MNVFQGTGANAPRQSDAPERRRVLVVDDEPLILSALTRSLGRQYNITALVSAKEALRRSVSGESWDGIVSDITMPEMNGFEFCRRLRAARPDLAERIVFMTGGCVSPRDHEVLEHCDIPIVVKPIDMEALLALLSRMASSRK
jgi:CheY-like chemotaxis protein